MKSYAKQYKLLFFLSWLTLYLIYPTWALPVSVTGRFLIYSGLIIYFVISGFAVSRWLDSISIDKPFIIKPQNLQKNIKDHKWLLVISFIALVFHIPRITIPILNLGDEALHIQGGLWVYHSLGRQWHNSLRYGFFIIICLALLGIGSGKVKDLYSRVLNTLHQKIHTVGLLIFSFLVLVVYFFLIKDIHYDLSLVRYAPVSRFLYLFSFFIAGINHIAPRIIQLTLYLFTAIYIYRTIILFHGCKTALIAVPFYLFSPIVFHYAHIAQLTMGVVFFIVLIAFYFLRYLKDGDKRDLLLTTFFIGFGFLYKEDILLMFFICSSYLILYKLKEIKEFIKDFKILWISIVPVIPWMIIQRSVNWRQYTIHWEHFTSDVAYIYLKLLWIQSHPILLLFLISIPFMFTLKRNKHNLTFFFAFTFVAFYFFYTADYTAPYYQHRFSVAFYPSIAVFLSQFLVDITKRINWRHSFKILYTIVLIYLIIHSTNPYLSRYVFPDNELRFPVDKAMKWVKENVKVGERIILLRIMPARFYSAKYQIPMDRFVIFWYELGEVSTYDGLKKYCNKNKIKYIMFPYSPDYSRGKGMIYDFFDSLRKNIKGDFNEVARFNIEKDYIYIYALQ